MGGRVSFNLSTCWWVSHSSLLGFQSMAHTPGCSPGDMQGSPGHEEGEASRPVALSATLDLVILALFPNIISITLKNDPNNFSNMIN